MMLCRIVRPMDIVHVVMISSTDGTMEQRFVDQYKAYLQAHNVGYSAQVTHTTARHCGGLTSPKKFRVCFCAGARHGYGQVH